MRLGVAAVVAGCFALPAFAQEKKEAPRIDDAKVGEAIRKGVDWLRPHVPGLVKGAPTEQKAMELVLWTFVHSGIVGEDDPDFQQLFEEMMKEDLMRTYRVSLQAMILEELDRVTHQWRIRQCAQFLVDNQGPNGQWSYGEPTAFVKDIPSTPSKPSVKSGDKKKGLDFGSTIPTERVKPEVKIRVPVKKMREGKSGDNSNTQYATLGLRACHDAGIILPLEVLKLGQKWYRDAQCNTEPGSGYPAKGWTYGQGGNAWGSMTAGGTGGLCIYDYILKEDWKRDNDVNAGVGWLAKNFTVTGNPKHENPQSWHYYYLYGLERAGMLYGTEKLGAIDWYAEGADYLLKNQKDKGSWNDNPTDTCFAILFLRRATRPLVATEKAGQKK